MRRKPSWNINVYTSWVTRWSAAVSSQCNLCTGFTWNEKRFRPLSVSTAKKMDVADYVGSGFYAHPPAHPLKLAKATRFLLASLELPTYSWLHPPSYFRTCGFHQHAKRECCQPYVYTSVYTRTRTSARASASVVFSRRATPSLSSVVVGRGPGGVRTRARTCPDARVRSDMTPNAAAADAVVQRPAWGVQPASRRSQCDQQHGSPEKFYFRIFHDTGLVDQLLSR